MNNNSNSEMNIQNNYGYNAEKKIMTLPFYFIPFAATDLRDGKMDIKAK